MESCGATSLWEHAKNTAGIFVSIWIPIESQQFEGIFRQHTGATRTARISNNLYRRCVCLQQEKLVVSACKHKTHGYARSQHGGMANGSQDSGAAINAMPRSTVAWCTHLLTNCICKHTSLPSSQPAACLFLLSLSVIVRSSQERSKKKFKKS